MAVTHYAQPPPMSQPTRYIQVLSGSHGNEYNQRHNVVTHVAETRFRGRTMGKWIIFGIAAALTVAFTIWWWVPSLDAHLPFVETLCGPVECSFAERASIYGGVIALIAIAFALYSFLTSGQRASEPPASTIRAGITRTGDLHDNSVGTVGRDVSGAGAIGMATAARGSAVFTGDNPTVHIGPSQSDSAPPHTSALHQLRQPVADFTGRQEVLARLLQAVGDSGVAISGVRGMGGIGKTELALVLAHRRALHYPDAQIFRDLRGASEEPATVSEAMAHVIRAFDPQVQLPQDQGALSALYHSTLSGKKALLLLDNASGADQVEPLIPPSGCLLLVTSRARFTLPGMHTEDVDTMSPEEARDLLLAIAPRIGDQADVIAELCGCLPQALRLAGSALAVRNDLTPEAYIGRLQGSTSRSQELEEAYASIATSYDLMNEESQTRFRLLAVFPETFDVAGAAAVWELDIAQAQDTLSDLRTYNLLEWSEATRRYHLHDLVSDFADSRSDDSERAEGALRHSAHYAEVLKQADDLFVEGGDSTLMGLAIFDAESENIRAGQRWAADNHGSASAARELCNRYGSVGSSIFMIRVHPTERIRWLEAGLQAARELNDRSAEAIHLGGLGIANDQLRQYRKVIEYYNQRLDIAQEQDDRRGEATALGNLGLSFHSLGEYRKAIEHLQRSLVISRESGNRRDEGRSLGGLGITHDRLGEHRRAIEFGEQHLAIARELGDRLGEGQSLGNLGSAYHALGENDKAIVYYDQRLEIAREIGDRLGEAHGLFNMSTSLYALGDHEAAIERMAQAITIYEAIGVPSADDARDLLAGWRGEV